MCRNSMNDPKNVRNNLMKIPFSKMLVSQFEQKERVGGHSCVCVRVSRFFFFFSSVPRYNNRTFSPNHEIFSGEF